MSWRGGQPRVRKWKPCRRRSTRMNEYRRRNVCAPAGYIEQAPVEGYSWQSLTMLACRLFWLCRQMQRFPAVYQTSWPSKCRELVPSILAMNTSLGHARPTKHRSLWRQRSICQMIWLSVSQGEKMSNIEGEDKTNTQTNEILTTATNCEFSGYFNINDTLFAPSANTTSTIFLASTAFGSGVGPNGMIRTRYGGLPSSPEMAIVKFLHCCGVSWKDQV